MRSHIKHQAGGTVMGLIIGLIIGLAIAVAVAMTILKTPLPFVDKLGRQGQPAGDIGDPNKNLGGGARDRREKIAPEGPSDEAVAPADAVKVPPVVVAPERIDSDNPPAPIVERPRTDKPATTLAPASAPPAENTAAPELAATGDEKFTYYLQAGAFREQTDAENTKGRLAMMGLSASIVERRSELGTLYRVRIGPFSEAEAMNRARNRLLDNGVDAAVVRMPK